MLITFADRPSDSPFVERVWRSHSDRAGVFHSMAACHWVMVVTRLEGKTFLTVRGPETMATMADLLTSDHPTSGRPTVDARGVVGAA